MGNYITETGYNERTLQAERPARRHALLLRH